MTVGALSPSEETEIALLKQGHHDMASDLSEIKFSMAAIQLEIRGKPSWAVTTYITLVTAFATGLVGYIIATMATH